MGEDRGTGADARWIAFDDLGKTSICAGPEVEVSERVIFRDQSAAFPCIITKR